MTWSTLDPATRELAQRTLTPRQLAILQDRINGHSWRTIALAYRIHEATARAHHKAALERLRRHRKDAAA